MDFNERATVLVFVTVDIEKTRLNRLAGRNGSRVGWFRRRGRA
jgi:hypothetical protein